MNTNRPARKAQTSRKGKKAWRKNIDLDTLEQDIEDRREAEIVLGPTPLFEVDTKGHEEDLTNAMREEKKLKSHEILYKRSAVPGLAPTHKKKEKPKTKAKLHDLVRRAGRNGEDSTKIQIEQDGLTRAGGNVDIWDIPEPATKPSVKRRITEGPHAPVQNESNVSVPHGGKSYNPSQDAWRDLITAEHNKLEKIEKDQELLAAERARIEALILANEEKSDDEEEEEEEEEITEFDGRLSVNDAAKNKKKTKQQRAKALRHKEREALHAKVRELKRQAAELERIKPSDLAYLQPNAPKPKKYRGLKGKHEIMEAPIEVKLSDEIEGSLRRLRPEGDLAKDRFRSLQARGLIEARVPTKHKRRYAKRVTEKWTYKDFNKTRPHGQQ